MIHICFTKEDNHYTALKMQGHANSANSGEDLVCAAVSAIAYGLANALNGMFDESNSSFENNVANLLIQNPNETTDSIMKVAWYQLETIRLSNKEFIEIEIAEV